LCCIRASERSQETRTTSPRADADSGAAPFPFDAAAAEPFEPVATGDNDNSCLDGESGVFWSKAEVDVNPFFVAIAAFAAIDDD
jgi:hypothetical protein